MTAPAAADRIGTDQRQNGRQATSHAGIRRRFLRVFSVFDPSTQIERHVGWRSLFFPASARLLVELFGLTVTGPAECDDA